MKYDKEFTLEKLKKINYKDFTFIMKFLGKFMKRITIQTECLSDNDDGIDIDDQIFFLIRGLLKNDDLHKIQIDDRIYDKDFLSQLNDSFSPTIDLQSNSINYKTLDTLIAFKDLFIREIKLLTDYSEFNINKLITEYLMHLETRELTIAGPSLTSIGNKNLNQCCDQILEAIANKSKNSLQRLTIKSCEIDNFYGLLNEFNNLNEIILVNIQHIGSDLLLMSGVKKHRWVKDLYIINCPLFLNDDLCYEFITNYFYVNENLFLCLLI